MSEVLAAEDRDSTVPDTVPPTVNDWNHAVIVNSSFSDSKLSDSCWRTGITRQFSATRYETRSQKTWLLMIKQFVVN